MGLTGGIANVLFVLLGLGGGVLAYMILRRSAKLAVAVWIGVICFVPVWIGAGIGASGSLYIPAASAVGLIVIATLLPAKLGRFTPTDGLMALVVLVAFASLLTGDRSIALSYLVTVFTYFVVGYVLGRVVGARLDTGWLYGAIAVAFSVVAVLALIEFFTRTNFFTMIQANNAMFTQWSVLQARGGVLRAEGAFGHSISLGSCLAMAIPMTLASRFRFGIKIGMVLLMLGATSVTFSRIGIIGALVGIALSILFLKDVFATRYRVTVAALSALLLVLLLPFVGTVFTDAGSEASGSAAYPGNLLSLIPQMNVVGVAHFVRTSPSGDLYFGSFKSIDSQLILTGLSSGLLVLIAIVVALLIAVGVVLSRRATAPTVALVAQIPALATVALITQYSIFLLFVVGLAVSTQLAPRAMHVSTARAVIPLSPRYVSEQS